MCSLVKVSAWPSSDVGLTVPTEPLAIALPVVKYRLLDASAASPLPDTQMPPPLAADETAVVAYTPRDARLLVAYPKTQPLKGVASLSMPPKVAKTVLAVRVRAGLFHCIAA